MIISEVVWLVVAYCFIVWINTAVVKQCYHYYMYSITLYVNERSLHARKSSFVLQKIAYELHVVLFYYCGRYRICLRVVSNCHLLVFRRMDWFKCSQFLLVIIFHCRLLCQCSCPVRLWYCILWLKAEPVDKANYMYRQPFLSLTSTETYTRLYI